jgi:hypothetical protein
MDHHDQAERSGGLVKKITPAQLRVYKQSWQQRVLNGSEPPLRTLGSSESDVGLGPNPYLIDARYASDHIRIFISSKMSRKPLQAERLAAAEVVDSLPNHRAWYWERDAKAGPYSTEPLCIRHAIASQGLILLLGGTLTVMTEKEYAAARDHGVPRYIFLKAAARPNPSVRTFIEAERASNVYQRFSNLNELKSLIFDSVLEFERISVHREIGRRRTTATRLSI